MDTKQTDYTKAWVNKMKRFIFSALAALSVTFAGQAMAAQCADSSAVASRLETRFGESLTYVGKARENHEVLVYASKKTGRWTMLVATPEGLSCLIATGRGEDALGKQLGQRVDVSFR